MNINDLWISGNENDWLEALRSYNIFIKKGNELLEQELENKLHLVRSIDDIKELGLGNNWYDFMLEKYFKWKYTAPNRYASTTKIFKNAYQNDKTLVDNIIRSVLNEPDVTDTEIMGLKAQRICGLGYAGASGLLALLFPNLYGTIDQFVAKSLKSILIFREKKEIIRINPMNLTNKDFYVITNIYREKSLQLNQNFQNETWTPRKIDKVLWAAR
jgi:hypothetical protein